MNGEMRQGPLSSELGIRALATRSMMGLIADHLNLLDNVVIAFDDND